MAGKSSGNITMYASYVALAFIFSYLEALIPFSVGIPGVKLGLANIITVYVLYTSGRVSALAVVTFLRIVLTACTFGNMSTLIYSFCGALLSTFVMYILYKTKWFTVFGVSVAGGVFHNAGQLIAAGFILETAELIYYMPFLLFAGMAAGFVIALIANPCIKRLHHLSGD